MDYLGSVDFKNVRTFELQFSCDNEALFLPLGQKFIAHDPKLDAQQVCSRLFMKNAVRTEITPLLYDVTENGYVMTRAQFEPAGQNSKLHCMMRFWFSQKEHAISLPDFDEDTACRCIGRVSMESLWKVNIYLGPFCNDGEAVPDVRSVLFRLTMPTPIVNGGYKVPCLHKEKTCYMAWSPKPEEKEVRFVLKN